MRSAVGLAAVWLMLAASAAARDVFVDNLGGDDRADGHSERSQLGSGPVRTLRRAMAVAHTGDRILLANTGVPYREMVSLSSGAQSGLSGLPFTIDGHGATLDGSAPVPAAAWEDYRGSIFRFRPLRMAYQQLFRDSRPLARRRVASDATDVPELEPLEWCLLKGHIYFRAEDGKLPDTYGLTFTSLQTGLTLDHVHDVVVANLVVQGFQLDGINAADGVRSCRLENVVSRGNGRSGLTVAGTSRVDAEGCLLGDNGDSQVRTQDFSKIAFRSSTILDNTAPAFIRRGGTVVVDGEQVEGEAE